MRTITKALGLLVMAITVSLLVNTVAQAQSPADDPGIGGVGSPTGGGLTGDGGPTVPFDGGMSLVLAMSGIMYASKKLRSLNYTTKFEFLKI